jgi:hypothetical protein
LRVWRVGVASTDRPSTTLSREVKPKAVLERRPTPLSSLADVVAEGEAEAVVDLRKMGLHAQTPLPDVGVMGVG